MLDTHKNRERERKQPKSWRRRESSNSNNKPQQHEPGARHCGRWTTEEMESRARCLLLPKTPPSFKFGRPRWENTADASTPAWRTLFPLVPRRSLGETATTNPYQNLKQKSYKSTEKYTTTAAQNNLWKTIIKLWILQLQSCVLIWTITTNWTSHNQTKWVIISEKHVCQN